MHVECSFSKQSDFNYIIKQQPKSLAICLYNGGHALVTSHYLPHCTQVYSCFPYLSQILSLFCVCVFFPRSVQVELSMRKPSNKSTPNFSHTEVDLCCVPSLFFNQHICSMTCSCAHSCRRQHLRTLLVQRVWHGAIRHHKVWGKRRWFFCLIFSSCDACFSSARTL